MLMPTGVAASRSCYQVPAQLGIGKDKSHGAGGVAADCIDAGSGERPGMQLGVPAAFLNSSLSHSDEQDDVIARLRDGQLRLLYIAPERLVQPGTRAMLSRGAHCHADRH